MTDNLIKILALIACTSLALTACAPYRPASGKAAICNQLNSQIIFSGSTADARQANIQRAEEPMVERTFDKDDCI